MSGSENNNGGTIGEPLVLEFDNNRLLPELYGEHGKHLSRIEQTLDVSLANRGNQVYVSGPAENCARAEQVLGALYAHLERGAEVTGGDVDGALRLSLGLSLSDSGQTSDAPNGADENTKSKKSAGKRSGKAIGKSNGKGTNAKKLYGDVALRTQRREVLPRSATQADYIKALLENELVVGLGPAGTGKTYLAVAAAATMLVEGKVDRIILSRPAVEAGENLGFLPGDMRDKVDPYLRPLYDALYDMLPGPQVTRSLESGEIEIAPLAFMRGRTLSNSFVILDESQNATPMQMKMFLTRMGENSRMVITGDPSQIDLPFGAKSGLKDAMEILPKVRGVDIIRFGEEDVVRHDMVTRIVKAYNRRDATLPASSRDGDRNGARKRRTYAEEKPAEKQEETQND
ncbi:MAG: PhoH family protein [Alphaproteobacteria bacterium]|nr:PhoH family protein [Alphaproteobacteria bacterium]